MYYLLPICQVYTEVWCVWSATNGPGSHWSMMCTICYQCFRNTLKSNVYHLLPIFQVHTEIWRVPSATRFSSAYWIQNTIIDIGVFNLFFGTFCPLVTEYYKSPSPALKQRLNRSIKCTISLVLSHGQTVKEEHCWGFIVCPLHNSTIQSYRPEEGDNFFPPKYSYSPTRLHAVTTY